MAGRGRPVDGRSALARILFGPLPAALIIIEALAVETRRGVNQVAAAACAEACHGVPTRLSYLEAGTVVLALVAMAIVWVSWRRRLGSDPRRGAASPSLLWSSSERAAAVSPWWGLAHALSLLALLLAIVAYQAAAGRARDRGAVIPGRPATARRAGRRGRDRDLRAVPARHPAVVAAGDRRDARVGLTSDLRLRRRRQRGAAGARRPRQRTAAGAPRRARRAGGRRWARPLGDLRGCSLARRRRRRARSCSSLLAFFPTSPVRRRVRGRVGRDCSR